MMNSESGWLVSALIALLIVTAPPVSAEEQTLPLWEVEGERNRIFLLGSIHLLREKDHPLPEAIYVAYDEAETLIMELDMDDIDPVATQKMTSELGLIENGGKLSDLLGRKIYAEATALAERADIPLHLLDRAEPWFAAMNVEMMLLMRMGFDPSLGV
ncbi:MAG: TraB/GumN family protein, partial [Woeseiales bacterium]